MYNKSYRNNQQDATV